VPVDVHELGGTGAPNIHFERRNGTAKRVVACLWGDVPAFLQELMPSPFIRGGRFVVPPAEIYPGLPYLWVKSADMEPLFPEDVLGIPTFPAVYSFAKVTVNYSTNPYDQNDSDKHNDGPSGDKPPSNVFLTEKVDVSGEYLTWPTNGLVWNTASGPFDHNRYPNGPPPAMLSVPSNLQAGVILPQIDRTLTFHFVPFPPWDAIRFCLGKVNAYVFAGAYPETLLFLGCSASREMTNQGFRAWTLDYKFQEKNTNTWNPANYQGWNHFLRTDGLSAGRWDRLMRKVPYGMTTLTKAANAGDGVFQVADTSGFPQGSGLASLYIVGVGNEKLVNVFTGTGAPPNIQGNGATLAGNWPIGTPVQQLIQASLAAPIGPSDTVIELDLTLPSGFPASDQFFVTIGSEQIAVIAGASADNRFLFVLRGIGGTTPGSHPAGSPINQVAATLYPLASFDFLFQPGLIVS
jgi:hypothetical protein